MQCRLDLTSPCLTPRPPPLVHITYSHKTKTSHLNFLSYTYPATSLMWHTPLPKPFPSHTRHPTTHHPSPALPLLWSLLSLLSLLLLSSSNLLLPLLAIIHQYRYGCCKREYNHALDQIPFILRVVVLIAMYVPIRRCRRGENVVWVCVFVRRCFVPLLEEFSKGKRLLWFWVCCTISCCWGN